MAADKHHRLCVRQLLPVWLQHRSDQQSGSCKLIGLSYCCWCRYVLTYLHVGGVSGNQTNIKNGNELSLLGFQNYCKYKYPSYMYIFEVATRHTRSLSTGIISFQCENCLTFYADSMSWPFCVLKILLILVYILSFKHKLSILIFITFLLSAHQNILQSGLPSKRWSWDHI